MDSKSYGVDVVAVLHLIMFSQRSTFMNSKASG